MWVYCPLKMRIPKPKDQSMPARSNLAESLAAPAESGRAPARARDRKRALGVFAALGFAACMAVGMPAAAQELDDASRTAARALGTSGLEAFEGGRFQEASDKLEKAYAIARVPTLGLWSARALAKLGRLLEAAARLEEAASIELPEGEQELQRRAKVEAREELETLQARIPQLVVEVEGAPPDQVSVTLDGKPEPQIIVGQKLLIDPGRHRIQATYGESTLKQEVQLAEGDARTLVLPFSDSAAVAAGTAEAESESSSLAMDRQGGASASPLKALGWVSVGLGGVGLVVGGVAGVITLGKKSDIEDNPRCNGNRCAPSEQDVVDSYRSARSISTIGFIAGGVLTAAGVTLLITQSSNGADTQAFIGPGTIGARGTF
jgi:hypothetical protein